MDYEKSCSFIGSKPTGLKKSLFLQDNGQFTFPRSCDLGGSCDLKIEIFKSCNLVGSKPIGFENYLRFALPLAVSEITVSEVI